LAEEARLAKKLKEEAELDAGAAEKQAYWDAQNALPTDQVTLPEPEVNTSNGMKIGIIALLTAFIFGAAVYFLL